MYTQFSIQLALKNTSAHHLIRTEERSRKFHSMQQKENGFHFPMTSIATVIVFGGMQELFSQA
jgi:uncharacterized membrane protein (DUF485 family)